MVITNGKPAVMPIVLRPVEAVPTTSDVPKLTLLATHSLAKIVSGTGLLVARNHPDGKRTHGMSELNGKTFHGACVLLTDVQTIQTIPLLIVMVVSHELTPMLAI
jgi:hypothetical protein